MRIKNREKLLTIVAVVCFSLLLGDRLVFTPLTHLWSERSDRIKELRSSVSKGRLLVDREDIMNQRWREMLTNALPVAKPTAEREVLTSFDRWMQDSGVSFVSIKPQWKEGADESYQTLECRAGVFGNLSAITRFLYELEQDPLALNLEELQITPRNEKSDQLTLSVLFSGLVLIPKS